MLGDQTDVVPQPLAGVGDGFLAHQDRFGPVPEQLPWESADLFCSERVGRRAADLDPHRLTGLDGGVEAPAQLRLDTYDADIVGECDRETGCLPTAADTPGTKISAGIPSSRATWATAMP